MSDAETKTAKSILTRQSVIAYVMAMPGSTQIEIAKSLTLNTGYLSAIIAQLANIGVFKKDKQGYGARIYMFNQAIPTLVDRPVKKRTVRIDPSPSEGFISSVECNTRYSKGSAYTANLARKGLIKGELRTEGGGRGDWFVNPKSVEQYMANKKNRYRNAAAKRWKDGVYANKLKKAKKTLPPISKSKEVVKKETGFWSALKNVVRS